MTEDGLAAGTARLERHQLVPGAHVEGQQGVSEARVTEIAPGKSMPPLTFAFDEIVYVVEGQGLCTIWQQGSAKRRLSCPTRRP